MSETVTLRAADGHTFSAYVARPATEPVAGLIVVQEIFGVNSHIRSVADGWANDGFLAVAPALFDRFQPGIELGYEAADMQTAMSLIPKLDADKAIVDVAAAIDFAAAVKPEGVGVIGDRLGQFLLRWERGELVIQPFSRDAEESEPPAAPEELSLIPAVTLLETGKLAGSGYPLHGNVIAEMSAFAEGTEVLGLGTWKIGPAGSLRLVEARGLDHGLWDSALAETGPTSG